MLERSLHISVSSYNVLLSGICPHSLSMGYKTEFASDHDDLPDADSSDGTAVCSTISRSWVRLLCITV